MNREERLRRLAAVNAAQSVEAEQTALRGAPGVDLLHDLPQDRGQLWTLHVHDLDGDDQGAIYDIAKRHGLPWERGARRYYVTAALIDAVQRDLEAEGFIVARGL